MSETTSQTLPPAKDLIGPYFIDLWRHTSETLARKPTRIRGGGWGETSDRAGHAEQLRRLLGGRTRQALDLAPERSYARTRRWSGAGESPRAVEAYGLLFRDLCDECWGEGADFHQFYYACFQAPTPTGLGSKQLWIPW